MNDFKKDLQKLKVSEIQASQVTPWDNASQYAAVQSRQCVGLGGIGGGFCRCGGGFCGGFCRCGGGFCGGFCRCGGGFCGGFCQCGGCARCF